ncbi:MAG: hypothetical protein DIU71_01230 [Proteobacteria bacterium]|nr:MAG: hypothetical protein DIU71_01230 [Pseudomonadota bacterium]
MKVKVLAAAVAAALGTLSHGAWAANLGLDATFCASNGNNLGIGADGRRHCALPFEIFPVNNTAPLDTIVLPRTNSVDETILWILPGVVTVGDGHVAGRTPTTPAAILKPTTLRIEAGVEVKGAIANSALVITRGSRIEADGTPENPIVFSSLDDNYTGAGEWGGVILSSWDNTNACNTTLGYECQMEGISEGAFHYGGYVSDALTPGWDTQSSGRLRYVVIAEGGHAINVDIDGDPDPNSNTGDEINGLTLYGVSAATEIDNVHIHNNLDDGIEYFGGSAFTTNIFVTCAGDDSVDWDFGFNGFLIGAYILQRDGADHAFELANNPDDFAAAPVANGFIANVTLDFVDDTPDVDAPFGLKEGTGGIFENIKIASSYTGNLFAVPFSYGNPLFVGAIEYAGVDNSPQGLLPAPTTASGYTGSIFWADYPGHCD